MKHATASRSGAWLPVLAMSLFTALPAVADSTFTIFRNCGPDAGATSAGPLALSGDCTGAGYGYGTTFGTAGYGAVGADAAMSHGAENSAATGGFVSATFATQVVFTSSDPSIQFVNPALNLHYEGSIAGAAGTVNGIEFGRWAGSIEAGVIFGGDFRLSHYVDSFDESANSTFISGLQVVDGNLTPAAGLMKLKTQGTTAFAMDTPIDLSLSIKSSAWTTDWPGTSAHADAANTFEIPFGVDVFDLPAGVTANSGDWLVNNRRVDLSAPPPPVPEPQTYALMALGLGLVALAARRRPRRRGLVA